MGKNKKIQSDPHLYSKSFFVLAKHEKKETSSSDPETKRPSHKSFVNLFDINWWFWFVNLIFIGIAVSIWEDGYYIVMEVSFLNLVFCLLKEKSLLAFPVQVRLVYFLLSFTGFWAAGRFYVYLLLLVDTFLITFYGKCSIALFLKQMPWNRRRETRLE